MKEVKLLERLTGKKVLLKEDVDEDSFITTPKNAHFQLVGLDSVYNDTEVEDLYGVLYWKVTFERKQWGIRSMDITAKMREITFELSGYNDDDTAVNEGIQKIDTTDYEIDTSELKFNDSGVLMINYVEIDIKDKMIRIS